LIAFAQFSVAAAEMALEDAGEIGADPRPIRCGHGNRPSAAFETLQAQTLVYGGKGGPVACRLGLSP